MAYDAPEEDVYDPTLQDYNAGTPTLDEVIRIGMRELAMTLRVALPASITAVRGCQQVDVQPTLQARYTNLPDAKDLPTIQNVPVVFPMGQHYRIKVPIAVGDQGLLVFSDRSLDAWSSSLTGAATLDPGDTRLHHISDAVFLPGMVPFAQQTVDETDDLVITAGKAEARVQQDGTFTMAANGQELLDLVGQLTDAVGALIKLLGSAQTMTLTMLGPQPFLASTQLLLQQQKAVVDEIKSNIASITGETP